MARGSVNGDALEDDYLATEKASKRFMVQVIRGANCWLWNGYKNHHGYGRILITVAPKRHKLMAVHRLAYRHFNGPIRAGMVVMHACDNRSCVNPAHLVLGTQTDNILDMSNKTRERRLKQLREERAGLSYSFTKGWR